MSDSDIVVSLEGDARRIGLEAAAWIQRRDFDGWTEADATALEIWLDQSQIHRVAFYRLDFGWQRTSRLAALRQQDVPLSRNGFAGAASSKIFRAAALLIVAAGAIGTATFLSVGFNKNSYVTPVGAHEILTLKDGSQIELNTDTALQIAKSGATREVWLQKGEAYFQVVHDPAHPFVVNAGSHRIVDIGTKFVVRRDGQNLRIAVVDGGIELKAEEGNSHTRVLTAGDVAVADAGSVSVVKASSQLLSDQLGWRRGVLVFHHTSLTEAARQINRYGGKKLTIADPQIGRLMIGGTFSINNVMALAEAAQDSFGVRVENHGDEIVLSH